MLTTTLKGCHLVFLTSKVGMQDRCAATTAELLLGCTKATVQKLRISFTPTLGSRRLTGTRSLTWIRHQKL